jgi:hypothetical protein
MNRRRISLLALTVAALASIATKKPDPGVGIGFDGGLLWIDPADPTPLVFQLEARLDEEAPRRAEIVYGRVDVSLAGNDVLPPERFGFVATGDVEGEQEGWFYASLDAECTEEACDASFEVRPVAPPGTPPLPLFLGGHAFVGVSDYDDEEHVRGTLTVTGGVEVTETSFQAEPIVLTVDPAAPPTLVARLEATSDAPLRGRMIEVSAKSNSPEPYAVRILLTDGVTSADESVTEASTSRFFAACTTDPCVATVEITFDVPADNGPFDMTIGASAVAYVDASAGAADVSGGLTLGPAAP